VGAARAAAVDRAARRELGYRDGADFAELHEWVGTFDPAAYLAVPKAIEVHAGFDREGMRALADEAERRLAGLGFTGFPGVPAPFMRTVELPPGDAPALWRRLYDEFRIEAPVFEWNERRLLRVSIGPYNDEEDIARLIEALEQLL
jgi:isopenicillin-N epimerase